MVYSIAEKVEIFPLCVKENGFARETASQAILTLVKFRFGENRCIVTNVNVSTSIYTVFKENYGDPQA